MHNNHKILLIFLAFFFSNLKAQDIHFSQYFNSPLSVNPAETGNFEGDWRAYANYRNQWSAIAYPFKTISAGYDQSIELKKNKLSIGGYVLNDQSGIGLKCNSLYISAAYHYKLNDNIITGGLQVGYVMKSVHYDEILFANDWNNITQEWQNDYGTNETDKDQLTYLDINVGLAWKRNFNGLEIEAGFAASHLNQPNESFYGNASSIIPMRLGFQTSVRKNISPGLFIKPGMLFYTMRSSRNMMLGGQAGFTLKSNRVQEIYGGLYLRNGIADPTDAFIAMVGAQLKKFNVNISYDMTVSSLRTYSNMRGAFEVSIIYKSITTLVKTFTIPCERL